MKKITVLIVFVLLALTTQAQQRGEFHIIAGLHDFSNYSKINNVNLKEVSALGFYAGLSGEFDLSKNWGIQTEAMIGISRKNGVNYGQIIMPVMIEYNVTEKLEFQLGPYVDYGMQTSIYENALGLGAAIGFEGRIAERIKARARFMYGLINRHQNLPDSSNTKFDYFQIGLSYQLFR